MEEKKKTYLWDRWGWWTRALRVQMCCVCARVALVCGCVACGRVGSLMLLPADADECKQKRKKLTWNGGCGCVACVHIGVTYLVHMRVDTDGGPVKKNKTKQKEKKKRKNT